MQRALANAGTDPVSGFTADEIAEAVETRYAPLGDEEKLAQARAFLRRYGYADKAAGLGI
jgi:hypothetical protein